MAYTTILSTTELVEHLTDPNWVILDCRFYLTEPERGEKEYLQAHIPGAVYVHLNRDLSGKVIPGVTGRHPLPEVEVAAETFSRLGITEGMQVVTYDAEGGALAAARAWWMLRWLGHEAVAVLDGGWVLWKREGRLVKEGVEARPYQKFTPRPRPELVVSAEEVMQMSGDPTYRILDSRSEERYHGINEIIDPVGGHIPGAKPAPYAGNLQLDGFFRPKEGLQKRFKYLLKGIPAERCIFYCGSGVTAAVNVLAVAHAELGDAKLYAGSWSEWITDPSRGVEK
jgi:thiosulfate/3-mercaptopyruvate sulfurtransferase